MKDDVINAPVEVVGAEELAARLNLAEQTAGDLKPGYLSFQSRRNEDPCDRFTDTGALHLLFYKTIF